MSLPYANTVVIKQIIFSGKFSHGNLLQMLTKHRKKLVFEFLLEC